ncbi:MAG: hypothetical protein Q3993_00755 [Filifactor alocis]|nr:hypothetical protein [Filifactor alocis]
MRRRGSILLTTILICTAILTSVTALTFGASFRIRGEGARGRFLQRELDENSLKMLMEEYALLSSAQVWDQMLESLKTREVTLNKTSMEVEYLNQFPKRSKDLSSPSLNEAMDASAVYLEVRESYKIDYETYTREKRSALRMEYVARITREGEESSISGALIIILPLADIDEDLFELAPGETNEDLIGRIPEIDWKNYIKTVYYE